MYKNRLNINDCYMLFITYLKEQLGRRAFSPQKSEIICRKIKR